jgi:hypothetical protein
METLWPSIARWSATGKFLLIGLGLLYVLIAGVVALFSRSISEQEEG